MNKIIFTGGGSAGHVTLNLALIPFFLQKGWKVSYVGSKTGIERDLIKKFDKVQYHAIQTGKLRRYFSWQNFLDMLKIPVGVVQAVCIVLKEKPDIIFSKGGFVSFPVVLAGFVCGVKSVMHESDVTPGLANKMSLPFVSRFFTTFDDTIKYVKNKKKVDYIGPVLSDRFEGGDKKRGCGLCGFDENKPVLMFVGGSLGAKTLNEAVRSNLEALTKKYQLIHICGRGQTDESVKAKGYKQFDYVDTEFKDLMEAADVVVSRAGSNAIFELLSLKKPMVLVPLPSSSSRGEQGLNAKSFAAKGFCEIIKDEDLTDSAQFLRVIDKVFDNRKIYETAMQKADLKMTNNRNLAQKVMETALRVKSK
ncbi:MAG: undecaprenyldiphospho-muramoylpentapeptide beta-N-acetylglucosaminyltransferase [Alphaproteobacteria bacterium]|nr:undecaprenyldiphospho-muramoylpentapeptide beta-N-acetylglucosaminyltransferase [Alphaproteobacteria bacterium]